jgi:hypothetical protein
MTHTYYIPCYDYINNIWGRLTVMKLKTEHSVPLYLYLPLTSNILLTTLLSQPLNLWSSLVIRHLISDPHKMTGKMSVLYISTCSILNWMVVSIDWIYPALFLPNIMVLKFCHDSSHLNQTYDKVTVVLHKQCDKIEIASELIWWSVQNPLSTASFINTDYQISQKFWIFVKREKHSTKRYKINSEVMVITWSVIGCWFSFSAI